MTSIERFVSFRIQISDAERSLYTTFRFKTPKHVLETTEEFYCRILALCHHYEEGLEFAPIRDNPDDPIIWKRDFMGNTSSWTEVGPTSKKKLQKALRSDGIQRVSVYFYHDSQIEDLCRELRGSTSDWIAPIVFYKINPEITSSLVEREGSSNDWGVTIADNFIFLETGGETLSTTIDEVDMWQAFQHSIKNE